MKASAALDCAAARIAAACALSKVARQPIGADELDDDSISNTSALMALSEGQSVETGYCIGATEPHEFEHVAALEVIVLGGDGDPQVRAQRVRELVALAAAAIAEDPMLGGLVDFAEIGAPDPSDEVRYAGLAATLTLTYTAPNALG